MFEGALIESCGQLGSPAVRWTAAGSLVAQVGLATLLVALPVFRPESLHMLSKAPELITPAIPKPRPIVRVRVAETAASASQSLPSTPARVENSPGVFHSLVPGPLEQDEPAPAGPGIGLAMGGRSQMEGLWSVVPSGANVVRAARPAGPVRVSSGVSTGMLLSMIQPVYPALAKAARVEGTVTVEAVISRLGRIESARAVSGPEMLRQAALDAVAGARYRPFELNGQPVEVQTTVTVNFRLGG